MPPIRMTSTRLFLDHGVDEARCERLQLESHGATFVSPWEFSLFSELSMRVDFPATRPGCGRAPLAGIVVGSRKVRQGLYETTVLFLDEMAELAEPELALEVR
jgi:hypothetical protein